jgi:hypothetical protein
VVRRLWGLTAYKQGNSNCLSAEERKLSCNTNNQWKRT